MDDLLKEVFNHPEKTFNLIWVLLVWMVAREFLPGLVKKLRNDKTPFLEIVKEKVDFLYLREKKRETIEEYKRTQQLRRSTDKKER